MPNQNLAPIPEGFHLVYGSNPQYSFVDANVTHDGHVSIRIEPDYVGVRECDGNWFPVKGGDHVIVKCWIKIENGRPFYEWSGARIGVDFIGAYSAEVNRYPLLYEKNSGYVHWGEQGWIQKTIDIIVPSDYFTKDLVTGKTIKPTPIISVAMWLQVWSSEKGGKEEGNAWFADAELYINPEERPPECVVDSDCPEGYHCESGVCVVNPPPPPECVVDSDCPAGYHCEDGVCVVNPPVPECVVDSDCPVGWHCENGVCVVNPVPASPMWVATECGLSQADIDRLRVVGHLILPTPLIDWYHAEGEDIALFLRTHPLSKRYVKLILDLLLERCRNAM